MSAIIFCESRYEIFTPIPGFYSAAKRLRDAGVETAVLDHFTRLSDDQFNAICAHLLTPSVKAICVHLRFNPTPEQLSVFNDRLRRIRQICASDTRIIGVNWGFVSNSINNRSTYPDIDYFFMFGYEVDGAVIDLHNNIPLEANEEGILGSSYVQRNHRIGRRDVDYARGNFFHGNSAYVMLNLANCRSHCKICWDADSCDREQARQRTQLTDELKEAFEQDIVSNNSVGIADWMITSESISFDPAVSTFLAEIAQKHEHQFRFVAEVNYDQLCQHPEILENLRVAGFTGLVLNIYSVNSDNYKHLGLSAPHITEGLAMIRSALGPNVFLSGYFVAGLPEDTYESVINDAEFLLSAKGVTLLDSFSMCTPYFTPAMPISRDGAYYYPFVGRRTSIGLRYWETDCMTCDEATAAVAKVKELSRDRYLGYEIFDGELSCLREVLSATNIGFSLQESLQLFRTPRDHFSGNQAAIILDRLERLKSQYYENVTRRILAAEWN